MLSSWLGRNGMNGSGGWVPLRVGLNDSTRTTTARRSRSGAAGRPMDQHPGRRGARVRPRHRRQDAGRHLPRQHPGVRRVTSSGGHRVVLQQPGGPSGLPDRRGGQPDRQGSDPQHVQPLRGRRPELLLQLDPHNEVHAAAGPGNHWFYLLAEGTQPDQRPAHEHDLQRLDRHRHRHAEGDPDHVQRDADEDDHVVLPEVPHVDADRGQEPPPGQLRGVQHGQGRVGRRQRARRRPQTRPARRPAGSPSPTRATSPARSGPRSARSPSAPAAAPRRTRGPRRGCPLA